MMGDWRVAVKGCRQSGDWEGAYNLLEQVATGASGSELGRVKYEHAYTRYAQDPANAPESLDGVRKALELSGDDDELRAICLSTGIGYCLHTSETEAAREFVTEAGRLIASASEAAKPWLPHLHIWIAYYWQSRQNYRLAIKHFQNAIEYSRGRNICAQHIAKTALGDVYWAVGRREEALRELRKALALSPSGADAVAYLRGRIAHGEGRLEEAERQLRLALDSAKPNDHLFKLKAVEALVQVLRDGGRIDEVAEILRPYKLSAMKGWQTRVLIRLQRLTIPGSAKGGEKEDVEGS